MKRVLYILCALLVFGCSKEKELKPEIQFDHVYSITDDPSDPIKHRIYNIYQKYKVPVYFNDTIGRVLVTTDVQGKPVYKYEKLDLAWRFSSYAREKYSFEYMTDPVEKSNALDIIEDYLNTASPALYPFSFFITQSGIKKDQDVITADLKNGMFEVGFRTIYMTGDWTPDLIKKLPVEMMRQMVMDKILNYPEDIAVFGAVSPATWYGGQLWNTLDPNIKYGWRVADALYDDYWNGPNLTAEEWEALRVEGRTVLGKFGFVWGNSLTKGLQSPKDVAWDLKGYIQEMLRHSPSKFEQLWGAYPLVMKKYHILSNVVVNKMGVKL